MIFNIILSIESTFFTANIIQSFIVGKRLEIRGFIISDEIHRPQYPAAIKQMAEWIAAVSRLL